MDRFLALLLWFAALSSGIMAGVYFTFSVVAMRAFDALGPAAGARAMQSVNRVILRTMFIPLFFLSSAASIVLVVFGTLGFGSGVAMTLGGVIYAVGMTGVTVVGNVPLNNRLDAVDADSDAGRALWADYRVRWTRLNHLRTLSSILAMGLFILALHRG